MAARWLGLLGCASPCNGVFALLSDDDGVGSRLDRGLPEVEDERREGVPYRAREESHIQEMIIHH
jgi:hypothetical protein